MWLTVIVTLQSKDGSEADYEVGADVDVAYDNYGGRERADGYEVGEPEISAPNCTLKDSRLIDETTLCDGWSDIVEEALSECFNDIRVDRLLDRDDYDRCEED